MDRIKPEDRFTAVHRAGSGRFDEFSGYTIDCKECGHVGQRGSLREAKEVRDAHEVDHQSEVDR